MLKTKNTSNDHHDVIVQNGHNDIIDSSGLSEDNLIVNGTSIVQTVQSLGAKPKQKTPNEILPTSSSENSSSHIENVTEKLSDLSVQQINSNQVEYIVYENELQMPCIMRLIQKDLSEPYSIYTYRYFIHNWPHLCFMVRTNDIELF